MRFFHLLLLLFLRLLNLIVVFLVFIIFSVAFLVTLMVVGPRKTRGVRVQDDDPDDGPRITDPHSEGNGWAMQLEVGERAGYHGSYEGGGGRGYGGGYDGGGYGRENGGSVRGDDGAVWRRDEASAADSAPTAGRARGLAAEDSASQERGDEFVDEML